MEILHCIDAKVKELFGAPYILPSATDEILVSKKKYAGVSPLYKYGCGACDDKSRNKWFSVCHACKDFMASDESMIARVEEVKALITDVHESEHPPLNRKRQLSDEEDLIPIDPTDDAGKRSRRSTVLHEKK